LQGAYAANTTPTFIALVDESSSPEFLELVRSTLLAAVEGLPPGSRFGLAGFSGGSVTLYEATTSGVPCVRHIPVILNGPEPTSISLDKVLPLENFLCSTSNDGKQRIADAVEAVEPCRSSGRNGRAMGEAHQAILRYLGTHSLENGIHSVAGARVFVFISGPPNCGRGSVISTEDGNEGKQKEVYEAPNITPFVLDPYFPELTAWTVPLDSTKESSNAAVALNQQEMAVSRNGWAAALESALQEKPLCAEAALKELGISSSKSKLTPRWASVPFYEHAGAAAASLGVAVDIFAVSSSFVGLELVHSLAVHSGGGVSLYPMDPGVDCALPQDVYKRVTETKAFGCLLRVRTSPELRVAGPVGNRLKADPSGVEDLFHLPCCYAHDAFCLRLEHASSSGFATRSTPVVQMVFQYLCMVPVSRSTNASCTFGNSSSFQLQRKTRIVTTAFPLAFTAFDVYSNLNPAVYLSGMVNRLWQVVEREGLESARVALIESAARLAAGFHEWITVGEFVTHQGTTKIRGEGPQSKVDVSFKAIESMQHVPHAIYALLRGPVLGQGSERLERHHPDTMCALRVLWETLPPEELSIAISPHLSSWHSPDSLAFPRHTLSRAALALAGQPVYLLDAYDTLAVYYTSLSQSKGVPFPPPSASHLGQHIKQIRSARRLTPKVVLVQEGREGAVEEFTARLIEDDALGDEGTVTYVQFLRQIESLVMELVEEENGIKTTRGV